MTQSNLGVRRSQRNKQNRKRGGLPAVCIRVLSAFAVPLLSTIEFCSSRQSSLLLTGQTLASWLEATQGPEAVPNAGVLDALEKVSARLREECRAVRERLLEDVALQRVRTPTARAGLEQLAWADSALHHAAGVARSLHGEAEE